MASLSEVHNFVRRIPDICIDGEACFVTIWHLRDVYHMEPSCNDVVRAWLGSDLAISRAHFPQGSAHEFAEAAFVHNRPKQPIIEEG